jgi:hypothetical protein
MNTTIEYKWWSDGEIREEDKELLHESAQSHIRNMLESGDWICGKLTEEVEYETDSFIHYTGSWAILKEVIPQLKIMPEINEEYGVEKKKCYVLFTCDANHMHTSKRQLGIFTMLLSAETFALIHAQTSEEGDLSHDDCDLLTRLKQTQNRGLNYIIETEELNPLN